MARSGAARLDALGFGVVVLPSLPYTVASFGAAFPGTLSVSGGTVASLVVDVAREVSRHGLAALSIANAHLDPAHVETLEAAVTRVHEEGLLPVAFPNVARKPWALRLTEEFRSGACHAGRYEGSIVLAERPELVREEIRKNLPPNASSLSEAIRNGTTTFEEAGGARAYFGWPADATSDEGRDTIATLGDILAEATAEMLRRSERA